MAHTIEVADYISFMEWFQDKNPDLYIRCWKAIAVPANADGVRVEQDGLDDETYTSLIDIAREYYQNKHK